MPALLGHNGHGRPRRATALLFNPLQDGFIRWAHKNVNSQGLCLTGGSATRHETKAYTVSHIEDKTMDPKGLLGAAVAIGFIATISVLDPAQPARPIPRRNILLEGFRSTDQRVSGVLTPETCTVLFRQRQWTVKDSRVHLEPLISGKAWRGECSASLESKARLAGGIILPPVPVSLLLEASIPADLPGATTATSTLITGSGGARVTFSTGIPPLWRPGYSKEDSGQIVLYHHGTKVSRAVFTAAVSYTCNRKGCGDTEPK